jgi:hypothetical protein
MYVAARRRVRRNGLGEILPPEPSWNSTNFQQVTANWDTWEAGGMNGSNWLGFLEAVKFGWVPNTQEGFRSFDYFWSKGGEAWVGKPDWAAWVIAFMWAEQMRYNLGNPNMLQPADIPSTALATFNGAVQNGYLTPAERDIAIAKFNYYWPLYAARFGISLTGAATAPVSTMAGAIHNPVNGVDYPLDQVAYAGPNPLAPTTESMLQLKASTQYGLPTWTWAGAWTGAIVGTPQVPQSLIDATANQQVAVETARQATLTWTTKYDRVIRPSLRNDGTWVQIAQREVNTASDGSVRVTPWSVYNAGTSFPLSDWQSGTFQSGDTSVGGSSLNTAHLYLRTEMSDAEWDAIVKESGGNYEPQVLVPYVPGSTVYVPAPGTGGTATITPAGSTTPIPVTQYTPPPAPTGTQYLPTGTPIIGGINQPQPAPPQVAEEGPGQANIAGGLSGLLLVGAVVGLLVASRKRRS